MDESDASGEPPDQPPSCLVEILDQDLLLSSGAMAWLELCAHKAMAELGLGGQMRVRIVDDGEMARLHERDTGVVGTTDVLTYDLSGQSEETRILDVDVVACHDEADRQARSRGVEPRRELLLYMIHAALHCIGHDDHNPEGFARMHALEDQVLESIGVGATFAIEPGETP